MSRSARALDRGESASASSFSGPVLDYFDRHAIDAALAQRLGVREKPPGTIVYPISDPAGSFTRWRSLPDARKRTHQPSKRELALCWFGDRPSHREMLVCEGEPDALAAMSTQHGPFVAGKHGEAHRALLGFGIGFAPGSSTPPARLIEGARELGVKRLIVAADNDRPGEKMWERLITIEHHGIELVRLAVPGDDDLAAALAGEPADRRAQALAEWVTDSAEIMRRQAEAETPAVEEHTLPDRESTPNHNGRAGAERAVQYEDGPGGLWWCKSSDERMRLANFKARIVADTVWDDGSGEIKRTYTIDAHTVNGPQILEVSASAFTSMSWVSELGAGAYLEPGRGTAERARHAVQVLSGEGIAQRRVFGHTGWREINGESVYLHAGGAIGPDGPVDSVEVSLVPGLESMQLPVMPVGADLRNDIGIALGLLNVGPDEIMIPLLGATYRAPLRDANLTVHLVGPTGVYKSQLAALAQQHYGAGFHALNLPGSWSSTPNASEMLAFTAKDALLVVDDFAPGGSATDISRAHAGADRLLRGQGNRSGRGRLRQDGTMRPPKPPRGLILSTGEDIPRGQSLRSRLVTLDVRPGDIKPTALDPVQEYAQDGVYARVMAAYLTWLAGRPSGELKAIGSQRERELRNILAGAGHARVPDNIAKLAAGFETFLAFASAVGAIDNRDELWQRCWAALLRVAGAQAEHQAAADSAIRFLRLLGGAITSGRAYITDSTNGRHPQNPVAFGWREDAPERWTTQSGAVQVGWVDRDGVYLDPEASYAAAQRAANEAGHALGVEPRTLHKRLRDGGWLVLGGEAEKRLTVRRSLGGVPNRRVLHLRAESLLAPTSPASPGSGKPGAKPGVTDTVPAFTGGFAPDTSPAATIEPGAGHDRPGGCSRSAPGRKRRPGADKPSADAGSGQDPPGSPGQVAS